ncbi:MAG: OmpA family protein [Muribaculaceae bacterium]|nr:OmpA family protein [Muribaculaceae bacterium]
MKTPDYNLKELPEYDDPVEAQAHRQSCAYPPVSPPPVIPAKSKSASFGWIGWLCGIFVAAAVLFGAIGLARHHYNNPSNQPLAYKEAVKGDMSRKDISKKAAMLAGTSINSAKAAVGTGINSAKAAVGQAVAAPQRIVKKVVRHVKGRPENIVYYFGKSANGVAENATLNQVAADASKANANVTVTGYADPSGSAAYNKQLSAKRAKSIGDYLISHGVPAENVKTKGAGVTSHYGDAAHNRRAEIHVDY